MLYAILKPLTVLMMRLYFRVQGRGQEHVPRSGPVLLVCNHASVLDPPLVGGMAPRPVSFMAKAELFEIPLLGSLIRRLNAHPVRREGSDPAALRTALRLLEDGQALLVFPEGTRGSEEHLREGKAGAGMLAILSKAPVVPVYVRGSGRAWPRGRSVPRPAKVRVWFGPPLEFSRSSGSRKESYDAASREMMAAIARLKDAAGPPEPGQASPRDGRRAVGGVGAGGASASPKYIHGRNGQYGEG
jgi:1-acyl-sn-glycerol-3-phosphate acyltransferase